MYSVKEIYYTLQGEGAHTGSPAVFCRFSGCNLWSGREEDRAEAQCYFCDTDFFGTDGDRGGKYSATELAQTILEVWRGAEENLMVVFTGGEPLLQLDAELIGAVKERGFYIAVESNGTIEAPAGIDWLTVSPKPNSELVQKTGDELKLVYPHEVKPELVDDLDFQRYYLMPLDSGDKQENLKNLKLSLEYCLTHPKWKLTLQSHKLIGIP